MNDNLDADDLKQRIAVDSGLLARTIGTEPAAFVMENIARAMRDMSQLTMAGIVSRVAEKHGLTVADLKGVRRGQCYSRPRQEAMWEMMQTGKWSTTRVGMFLGGRDHTTVLHGVRAHERRMGG